jgi:signal transduction histidine kinase
MKILAAEDFKRDVAMSRWQQPSKRSGGPGSRLVRRTVAWPVALVCVFLIFVIASSIYLVVSSKLTGELLKRALVVETKLAVVLSTVRNAESAERGYLLTGDADYLKVFETAANAIQPTIADLTKIIDQGQQNALAEMVPLIERKFADMGEIIRLYSSGNSAAALEIMHTGVGRILMTDFSAMTVNMTEEAQRILSARASLSELTNDWLLAVNFTGFVLIIVLALIFIIVMRHIDNKEFVYLSALERSNQELDDFAYIASHDLKEPLRGLFNHAQFLLEDYKGKLEQDGVRRLARIGQLCQRMEQLINDLMYFSRLGRADLAIQETDFNAVIADIQQTIDVFIGERCAQIVIPRPLPIIVCDRARTTEVFRNLITNAIKYNVSDRPLIEISFIERANFGFGIERNIFCVKDNGIGIEAAFHQEIFRIFRRLHPEDGKESGTGVGLTFVKKIVERQGGRVWLESEVGKGTSFYFTLMSQQINQRKGTHE